MWTKESDAKRKENLKHQKKILYEWERGKRVERKRMFMSKAIKTIFTEKETQEDRGHVIFFFFLRKQIWTTKQI